MELEEESPLVTNHKDRSIPSKLGVKGEVISSEYVASEDAMSEFLDQDPIEKGLAAPLLMTPGGLLYVMSVVSVSMCRVP